MIYSLDFFLLNGGVNDNGSWALFDTLTAAGTLLVIDTNPVIFHGKSTFGAILNATIALDTPHLADLSNNLPLLHRNYSRQKPSPYGE